MARIAKAICPHCDAELEQDECYDTQFGYDCITNFMTGHCPTCDKEFQWVEVYDYTGVEDIEEVT